MTEFVLQVNAGGAWKTAQKLTDRAMTLQACAELDRPGQRNAGAGIGRGGRQGHLPTGFRRNGGRCPPPALGQAVLKAEFQNQRTATLRRGLVLAERLLWGATIVSAIFGMLNAIPLYLDAGGFPGRTNALIFALARAVSEIAASLRT